MHRLLAILLLIAAVVSRAGAATTCGNGLLDAGETCTACPADCVVQRCTAGAQRVIVGIEGTWTADEHVSGVTVVLSYRGNRVSLPGKGSDSTVRSRVTDTPADAVVAVNDLDYALRVVLARGTPMPAGRLLNVAFDQCDGAPPVTASDFACSIEGCASVYGPAASCGCRAILP